MRGDLSSMSGHDGLMATVDDIRRENLEKLVKENGTQAALARRVGVSPNQLSQWLGKGTARNISSDSARMIEAACEKPHGWLDVRHDESQSARLDATKLAHLIEVVDSAAAKANRPISARAKAQIVVSLYESEQVPAAVEAALASILASMELSRVEPYPA